jgi:predicted CoA-binding protein
MVTNSSKMKKTVLLGASNNPERYAYKAANMLVNHGHEIVAVGFKEGEVAGQPILKGEPIVKDVDTVTLYLNPKNQEAIYQYVLKLKPKRVIFNPGTENDVFMDLLEEKGIETVEACTLVLLSTNQF